MDVIKRLLIISLLVIFSSEMAYGASDYCTEIRKKWDRLNRDAAEQERAYKRASELIVRAKARIADAEEGMNRANRNGDRWMYDDYRSEYSEWIQIHNGQVDKQRAAHSKWGDFLEKRDFYKGDILKCAMYPDDLTLD